MTIDPYAQATPPPYVPAPPPPTSRGRRRPTERPTAWFVAAIITFVQSGLALLGGLGSLLMIVLFERDSGDWVDADGNRYENEYSSYNDDGDLVEVTYDPGVDLPWAELAIVGSITLVTVAVLVGLGVMVVRGRRWAAGVLAAVELLLIAGAVFAVVQIASTEDEFGPDPGAFVGPLLTSSLPIAVLISLVVGAVQLRSLRSRSDAEPTHAA